MNEMQKAAIPSYAELTKAIEAQTEIATQSRDAINKTVEKLELIRVQHEESAELNTMWRDRYIEEIKARKKQRLFSWAFMLTTPTVGISVALMDDSNPIKTSLVVIIDYLKGLI